MTAASTKSLFRAIKHKPNKGAGMFADLPDQTAPDVRDPLDYDPTPWDATAALLRARDGHGRWLKHIEALGVRYAAMLLNWDWIAARINGLDELHARFPVSRVYVCCWKIDFRGGGSPPQRNGWLVWDRDWQGETVLRRLFREGAQEKQEGFL